MVTTCQGAGHGRGRPPRRPSQWCCVYFAVKYLISLLLLFELVNNRVGEVMSSGDFPRLPITYYLYLRIVISFVISCKDHYIGLF